MDSLCDHPFSSTTTMATTSSYANYGNNISFGDHEELEERCESMVLQLLGRAFCLIITFIFATVGTLVGVITGSLLGLATETGLFRGAGIGAISGTVFSIEVVESSLALWHSHRSGIWCILFVIDTIFSLLSGRLVCEKIGPTIQNAIRSQMSDFDAPFQEILDVFETCGTKGMSKDALNTLPIETITSKLNLEVSMSCSVCLQEFQVGEAVRNLAQCHHMFHQTCIDSWLMRHGSCPLCRRNV